MRLAHSMADTLITPINDSFVDFDVLGNFDPLSESKRHAAKLAQWNPVKDESLQVHEMVS